MEIAAKSLDGDSDVAHARSAAFGAEGELLGHPVDDKEQAHQEAKEGSGRLRTKSSDEASPLLPTPFLRSFYFFFKDCFTFETYRTDFIHPAINRNNQ